MKYVVCHIDPENGDVMTGTELFTDETKAEKHRDWLCGLWLSHVNPNDVFVEVFEYD